MIHIEPVRPDDWTAALTWALARTPADQRAERVNQCVNFLENGVLDPRGIWIAKSGSDIVGAQVCVPLAGASALFWLPTATNDIADALVQAALDWCRSIGCKLAQALTKPEELSWSAPLVRRGFRLITRLHQLKRDLDDLPAPLPSALRYENYRPSLIRDFAATLERSYEGTLDCPELNDKRTMDEILAGHRGQGKFHADFWRVAYLGAQPVGVLMLVEMPDALTWELAYVGVVPEFRRQGLGRAMVIHALHALAAEGAAKLLLAVDDRNAPALGLYSELGFTTIESNEVLLHFFP